MVASVGLMLTKDSFESLLMIGKMQKIQWRAHRCMWEIVTENSAIKSVEETIECTSPRAYKHISIVAYGYTQTR